MLCSIRFQADEWKCFLFIFLIFRILAPCALAPVYTKARCHEAHRHHISQLHTCDCGWKVFGLHSVGWIVCARTIGSGVKQPASNAVRRNKNKIVRCAFWPLFGDWAYVRDTHTEFIRHVEVNISYHWTRMKITFPIILCSLLWIQYIMCCTICSNFITVFLLLFWVWYFVIASRRCDQRLCLQYLHFIIAMNLARSFGVCCCLRVAFYGYSIWATVIWHELILSPFNVVRLRPFWLGYRWFRRTDDIFFVDFFTQSLRAQLFSCRTIVLQFYAIASHSWCICKLFCDCAPVWMRLCRTFSKFKPCRLHHRPRRRRVDHDDDESTTNNVRWF